MKKKSTILLLMLASLLIIGCTTVNESKGLASGSIKVAIIGADDSSNLADIHDYLVSFSDLAVVDTYDVRYSTPTLATLLNYDAVLAFTNYAPDDPVALGNALADYVDAGGGVVLAVFSWYNPIDGRIITDYSPFVQNGSYPSLYSNATLDWFDVSHPIMEGVSTIKAYYRDNVNLTEGAQLIANWSDGHPFVAIKEHVVGMTLFPPTMIGDWEGDVPTLVHNALLWSVEDPVLELVPDTGFATTTIVGSGGFAGNSNITITWDGTTIPTVPQQITTDVYGNFTAIISVPTQNSPGAHVVTATDEYGRSASMTFTVVDMTGPTGQTGANGTQGATGATGTAGEVSWVYIAAPASLAVAASIMAAFSLVRKRP